MIKVLGDHSHCLNYFNRENGSEGIFCSGSEHHLQSKVSFMGYHGRYLRFICSSEMKPFKILAINWKKREQLFIHFEKENAKFEIDRNWVLDACYKPTMPKARISSACKIPGFVESRNCWSDFAVLFWNNGSFRLKKIADTSERWAENSCCLRNTVMQIVIYMWDGKSWFLKMTDC